MIAVSLGDFKLKIENWTPSSCPGWLCKKYLYEVGFIWKALHSQV